MRARVASACARRARARKNTPALQRYFNTSASKYTTHYVDGLELSRLHHLKSFDPMITNMITNSSATDSRYILIGQDFNMSHRCDMLGSLLPRWTSGYDTVKLSKTKLRTLPPLVLGRIIENQNSDFVMT